MGTPAVWAGWLLLVPIQDTFQPERRVSEPTHLDWEFVAGPSRLPPSYDSRRQRYQLFVPPGYDAKRLWPLVLVVSPGDDALGWKQLQKPCEDGELLFASAYAAGAARPDSVRARATLDVLDDVRRHYRVDPARTYVVGLGEGGVLAAQLAFCLPEAFGGVASERDAALPSLTHLRHRTADRLSVALVGPARGVTLFRDLRIRAREGEAPWADVLAWLDEDRKRREKDPWPALGRTRDEVTAALLKQAKAGIDAPAEQYKAAALLEWLSVRHGRTDPGREARTLYERWRAEPREGRRLAEVIAAERRPVARALAREAERRGRLEEARDGWREVERLTTDPEERAAAKGHAARLAAALAKLPYLGVTFAGDTNAVRVADGPAHAAGLRVGDRVERAGERAVRGPDDVRRAIAGLRPGARLELEVRRVGESRVLTVRVGSRGDKSEGPGGE